MASNMPYHIANLLDKMVSTDKDFRFMATNDLMTELQKDSIKLDDDSEKKVVKMLLKLLEDQNGEVQNLAVKCLGPLVNKVKEYQVETIVDTLCTNMMSEKEQLRDISSIGLKTVIMELPPTSTSLAASVCKKITGRLTSAIAKQEDVPVQLEALDILSDMLSRFGSLLLSFQPSIQSALLPQLASARLAVRKRAIIAIGYLVMSSNNCLYDELLQFLLKELQRSAGPKEEQKSTTRTYIQCLGCISRQSGSRIGSYLPQLMPIIMNFCQVDDDELREYCIQAFESFILRAPKEITEYIGQIIKLCLDYLSYDPNYNYDGDGDDDMDDGEMDVDETEGEPDEEDDYSDDDDVSWKIRRAAAKCLNAAITTRQHMLSDLYRIVSPVLISRFKEREENVKTDMFLVYAALLRQTKPVAHSLTESEALSLHPSHPVAQLKAQLPDIIKAVTKQLKERSVKTRQACFSLLTELTLVLPGCLSPHIASIVPGIIFSLTEKNSSSTMKIDTLAFINTLITSHPAIVFLPHLQSLVPAVVTAVGDNFYKIVSEALLVAQQFVKVIRPVDPPTQLNKDLLPFVENLYHCALMRLKASDIDQEVKERAISCMGQILYNLGDCLPTQLSVCLPIFIDRLKNEITRLTTVKALALTASSPLKIDLKPYLPETLPILASFLRKNHRALRLSTLLCLDVLLANYGYAISLNLVIHILKEFSQLINEADLHISQLTITLLSTVCITHPHAMTELHGELLTQILTLLRSPLLQGSALTAMLQFFQALCASNTKGLQFRDLLRLLTEPVYQQNPDNAPHLIIHKQAFLSIAKCVATLALSNDVDAVVNEFLHGLNKGNLTDSVQLFSLLVLGEIGRHQDLSRHAKIEGVIIGAFSSSNEDVKTAASYALGAVAVGNLSRYLSFVLNEIKIQPRRQYLLLHSLKEIISCESNPQVIETFRPHIGTIWSMLMDHCECPEEGTRNVVAECLGKLTLLEPETLLPKLRSELASESTLRRATVVTSIKFTISDQKQPIDDLLKASIGDFLTTLCDPDLSVRHVALVMFNSAAHNKPALVRDLLSTVLPYLYEETKLRKELIREVEMGPFKHTVDDGLDLRKAAFECMYTLLDSCLDRIDVFEFLNHVEHGLKDQCYDVKMLTYLVLVRLANLSPGSVLQRVDRLLEPLKQTCFEKIKSTSVKQEFEKQDELKRSALRALLALQKIPGADKSTQLTEFVAQIRTVNELAIMYESVQRDSTGNASGSGDPGYMDITK